MRSMFIVDFDDTLFDTNAFKQARFEAVGRLGVSEDEFWESYRRARHSPDGRMTYSDERHAELLGEMGYNKDEVASVLIETHREIGQYLFPDALDFLAWLRREHRPVILLSLGNPGFQEMKTKGTGVDRLVDRVSIVHDTKRHVLEEFLGGRSADESVWLINDKIGETQDLLRHFPEMQAVLKQREDTDPKTYKELTIPSFETIAQIRRYLETVL